MMYAYSCGLCAIRIAVGPVPTREGYLEEVRMHERDNIFREPALHVIYNRSRPYLITVTVETRVV